MRNKVKNLIALVLTVLILACVLNDEVQTSDEVKFWSFLHLILHSAVILQNYNKFKFQYSPFVLFMAILNLFTWGVAPFFVDLEDFQLGTLNPSAITFSFYGYVVFYFLLYNTEKRNLNRINKRALSTGETREHLTTKEIIHFNNLKYIFLALYALVQFITLPINGFDVLIIYYTCGLLIVGFYLNLNNFFQNILFIAILLTESYNAVSSGLIFPLIFLSIFLFVLVLNNYRPTFKNHTFTIVFGGAVLLFAIIFSSIKGQYRSQNSTEFGVAERINLVRDLLEEDQLENEEVGIIQKTQTGPIWRMSYPVSALSMVMDKTPTDVPFWNGESYAPLIYKWIPRFIWPDKPSEQMGQIFGHRYRILREDDLHTSMNTPIIAEAYMNFSYFGIFAVMILMGLVIGNVYFMSNLKTNYQTSRLLNLLNVMKVAYLTTLYVQWESNLSLMLGKILILFLSDLALRKYLIKEKTLQ
jgi:hypothetical protein